ncbi:hypothetical protein MLD38_030773 [Melastoma candidum]|uniref:Uncharacterized protein n=1 Tax=Melastoma candidum TaxID=119954 RepID=A0ACB9MNV3_9MYRT|nr:hypothetical protein MLD38_030773 [Melastoma candidum]
MASRSSCTLRPPMKSLLPPSSDHSFAGTRQLLLLPPTGKLSGLSMKVPLHGSNYGYLSGISFCHAFSQIKVLLSDLNTGAEPASDHQGQGSFKARGAALFMANALLLTCPLEALAETCEADSSFFNMPVLLFVALIGATVGGLLARQRRGELKRLNEQLRQINAALRRQAKIESYAPALSYAPVGSRIAETEVIVDPNKDELIRRLKSGKNFLRNQDPEKAFPEFQAALELARALDDPIEEKKAVRGLGASLQRQGKYRDAIKYHSMVLQISERKGEDSGTTEAYGAIADCYTELGDLERAGRFYDKYISRLESD